MSPSIRRIALIFPVIIVVHAAAQEPAGVARSLAVQDAQRRGRDLLQKGKALEAVGILEEQLPHIDGNASYLGTLREAYGEAIKALQLSHKNDEAAGLQKRLQVLERSGGKPDSCRENGQCKPETPVSSALAAAERAFAAKQYREANELFAKAHSEYAGIAKTHGGPWAYCKLFVVHERLTVSETAISGSTLTELESEATAAMSMASADTKLTSFGKSVLEDVRRRKQDAAANVIEIKHLEADKDGWQRAESANLRVHHRQSRERAEQIVRAIENARTAAIMKWAGESLGSWSPLCDVYLHATAADYASSTGKGEASPGHATYQLQNGAVIRRRLDLRADDPNLLTGLIPHETTHLVLGDLFADAPLPRWADEGMAVLAEPRSQVERYAKTLHRCRAQGELVHLVQLLQRSDYPEAAGITAFYVESVSVVDFLVELRGPKVFVQFLKDAQRGKLEAALQKHYECRTVAELEGRWLRHLFPSEVIRASSGK
jgi:hypothetical protein